MTYITDCPYFENNGQAKCSYTTLRCPFKKARSRKKQCVIYHRWYDKHNRFKTKFKQEEK